MSSSEPFDFESYDNSYREPSYEPTHEVIDEGIIDDIVTTSTAIVDQYGDGLNTDLVDREAEYKSGYFILNDSRLNTPQGTIPSLTITIPIREFAEKTAWRAELTFGYQASNLSEHIVINKDNSIVTSYYDGRPSASMSLHDALEFSKKLNELAIAIDEDYIDPFKELPTAD